MEKEEKHRWMHLISIIITIMQLNGIKWNESNEMQSNGMETNGMESNGMETIGIQSNEMESNAMEKMHQPMQ